MNDDGHLKYGLCHNDVTFQEMIFDSDLLEKKTGAFKILTMKQLCFKQRY